MRYGVLVVTPVSEAQDRKMVNIGDQIQAEAILWLYEQMGIPRKEILRLDLKELTQYRGEYVILPININLSLNWIVNVFPMSPYIIPVFLGLSYFAAEDFPPRIADYFRSYAPIGCRDEATLRLMRKNNIPAYLYGCVSSFLPNKNVPHKKGKKVFLVDVPGSFKQYCKVNSIDLGETEQISHIMNNPQVFDHGYLERTARYLLERYHREASLVVTSRLHCMAPCMAMGVPVIPVTDNISHRMGWIDRYLSIYTPQTYHEINWSGQEISYEKDKRIMIDIAISRIQNVNRQYAQSLDWSFFLESRERYEYGNYFKEILKKLPAQQKKSFKYILWGAGQIGINVHQIISEMFPNSKLVGVVDSYCDGTFFGVPIQKPSVLNSNDDSYIFITTTSGEHCARTYLTSIGKVEGKDFLCMSTTAG